MLRHGFIRSPLKYEEINIGRNTRGIWITAPPTRHSKHAYRDDDEDDEDDEPHDLVVYYCHGGGFSMGSAYFYLEFLMTWLTLLRERGPWRNPAVFAVEYELVPHATHPTQLVQTLAGYEHVLRRVQGGAAERICIAGDSAGGTLQLSLLLALARGSEAAGVRPDQSKLPGFATLISPWCALVSDKNRDTPSDYLNAESLHLYAREYVGQVVPLGDIMTYADTGFSPQDPIASPGDCRDAALWKKACPRFGYHFVYGSEEVFAPEIHDLVARLKKAGAPLVDTEEHAGIHAWPVVALFLENKREARLKGLVSMVDTMVKAMKPVS